jgi:hypothetical protein
MLEYPLTDAIPTIDSTKDQLLGKIYRFRKDHMRSQEHDDGADGSLKKALEVVEEKDYALLYAYTLVTAQAAAELKKVREEIENLFGVLGEDELLLE